MVAMRGKDLDFNTYKVVWIKSLVSDQIAARRNTQRRMIERGQVSMMNSVEQLYIITAQLTARLGDGQDYAQSSGSQPLRIINLCTGLYSMQQESC